MAEAAHRGGALIGKTVAMGAAASSTPRVLIIGGGFGGVFAARRLAKAPVQVTILDRNTSNLFQPLLYQCATGILSEGQITLPLRSLVRRYRNCTVLQGEAVALNAETKVVSARRPDGSTYELAYDYLIVAAGMRQSYFGNDRFAEFAPGMKTLDDALEIRRRIYGAFEMAESLPTPAERKDWLTFAVVGAGPTGVELAGQIRELALKTIAKEFTHIDPTEARVLLFDGVDAPLQVFGEALSARAVRDLEGLGVELHMGVLVVDVDARGLTAKSRSDGRHERFAARTVLWTAGVEAVPFVKVVAEALGVSQDRAGRIAVEEDLTVPGHPDVWVLGDIMALNGLPGVAEVALQGGLHAGGQIRRLVEGRAKPEERFRYRDLGSAAYISRFKAVVHVGRFKLSGFLAWLIWGFVHLAFLASHRHRASTVTSWMFNLARGHRTERAYPEALEGRRSSVPESP